jgi:hypothetical protein
VCRNGRWQQTNVCDATEDIGDNVDRQFQLKGNAVAPNEVDVLIKQAVNAWNAAETANENRQQAAKDCETC